MRIVAGTHKGRKIKPPNNLNVRPTTDRAKEALLNIINNRYLFEKKTMLDLFSGTGNISLEFASRGVENVVAVDHNSKCIEFITATAKEFGFDISTVISDGFKYAQNCKKQFDFIFIDPPYNYNYYQEIKEMIIKKDLVKKNGLLIIEHNKETVFGDDVEVRKYGAVHFSIFTF